MTLSALNAWHYRHRESECYEKLTDHLLRPLRPATGMDDCSSFKHPKCGHTIGIELLCPPVDTVVGHALARETAACLQKWFTSCMCVSTAGVDCSADTARVDGLRVHSLSTQRDLWINARVDCLVTLQGFVTCQPC